jgi:hypothetical protein
MANKKNQVRPENASTDEESEPQPMAASPSLPGQQKRAPRYDFKPEPNVHLTQAGNVAQTNWIGLVQGRRVHVYRGAQYDKVPAPVRKAAEADGIKFGPITHRDLGLPMPVHPSSLPAMSVTPSHVPPGANLLG